MRISRGDWKCPGDFIYVFWWSLNYKKKLLTNEQKLGIHAHPLGLSVGKKGLGLEGLTHFTLDYSGVYMVNFI